KLVALIPLCFSLVFSLLALAVPAIGLAAFNDVTLTTSTNIVVNGFTLNVSGSNAVIQSIKVNSGNFVVTLAPNSTITVTSTAGADFSANYTDTTKVTTTCSSGTSTLTLSYSGSSTSVVTVTPASACNSGSSSSSSSGGNGSPLITGSSGGGVGPGTSFIPYSNTSAPAASSNTVSAPAPTVS